MPACEARPAATVMVVRPAQSAGHCPELLLLRRARTVGFFPSAWVFPGGRVDPADARAACRGAVAGLPQEDRAFGVAAARETFEEAGVWVGDGPADEALRDRLNNRTATLDDAPELVAHLDRLTWWSWWITPESEPKRYDTRFFLCIVRPDEVSHAAHDNSETVQTLWLSAGAALERHQQGTLFMAPPTFRTLTELAPLKTVEAIAEAARHRCPRAIQPRLEKLPTGKGFNIVLPGDPSYPSAAAVCGPTRMNWVDGHWEDGGVVLP